MKKINLLILPVVLPLAGFSQEKGINLGNLKKHIAYLADDKLEGRGTGSEGAEKAAGYIARNFEQYKLKPCGDSGTYFYTYTLKPGANPHEASDAGKEIRNGKNVVGLLNNGAEYTIVIGAHYDHLGLGMDHNSLDANPEGKIHNGADDNASGVAGVLELARYFSSNSEKEKYNLLFICFSGEELGLYGSKKFCERPAIDLSGVDCMINMDMIGRLNDSTQKLIIYGVGTAPDFVPVIDKIKTSLSIKKDSAGIGPSDQTSFYLKNIPVLHFFTGQHSDYHKPSDDADKINYSGEVKVLQYIVQVLNEIEKLPKLKFLATRNPDSGKTAFKVTMGVMPDYTFEGKGMRVDGVTEGRPAAKAGIQKGDIVILLGEMKVESMNDYMKALSQHSKGDTVPVIILREGKEVTLNVTF